MNTTIDDTPDVFQAAAWLNGVWNSTAHAVTPDFIRWQCRTWGSGDGYCYWAEVATFEVVAAALDLTTYPNDSGRGELIVEVPRQHVARVRRIIEAIGDFGEDWPWYAEDTQDLGFEAVLSMAADALDMDEASLLANENLARALRLW